MRPSTWDVYLLPVHGLKLKVSLYYMKCNVFLVLILFIRSVDVLTVNRETVVLQLVQSFFCKSHVLYDFLDHPA